MKEARRRHIESDGKILCILYPRFYRMGSGQAVLYYIRENGGKLYSPGYGTVSASIRPKRNRLITFSPDCRQALIRRSWHGILENQPDDSRCPSSELPSTFNLLPIARA